MSQGKNVKDKLFYLEQLKSEECICGRQKKRGYSFCFHCYDQLPGHMKNDLFQLFGKGYEEAYEAAVEWLYE